MIRSKHDVRVQEARLLTSWNRYKHSKSKNSLFKAVLRTYRWEYTVAILWNVLVCALQLASPFLLRQLILFIQDPDAETIRGLLLVAFLSTSQGLAYLITENINFYTAMTGCISTNALVAMIYGKLFTISSASNKKFDQGQLVNFVQVDALKL